LGYRTYEVPGCNFPCRKRWIFEYLIRFLNRLKIVEAESKFRVRAGIIGFGFRVMARARVKCRANVRVRVAT
jgi:hypothetical protein